jgi:class 3 adenylate cyclase
VTAAPAGAAEPAEGIDAALAEAERAGLRLLLRGRQAVLVAAALWFGYGVLFHFPQHAVAFAVIAVLLALGYFHLRLIGGPAERGWHKYAFYAADLAILGVVAASAPLSTGGHVPQILIFRAYGAHYLVPFVAVAALALSPRLVLFAGAWAVAVLWAVFAWIVAGMERTVSWTDLPPAAAGDHYVRTLLDPDFVGRGNRIEESMVLLASAGLIAVAVARARGLVRARAAAEVRRRRAEAVFGRFVPEPVAVALLDDPDALRPQTREATILMADIEGFTRLSERHEPAAVVSILNAFFTQATAAVDREGGVVLGFAGDALLASFNAPVAAEDHARRGLAAGEALLELVRCRRFDGEALRLRVGIATGPVAAGSIGGEGRQAYTVYGDTVNLAQRLEAMNKKTGTRMLVSAATARAAGADTQLRRVGTVAVRGRDELVEVLTPVGRQVAAPVPHSATTIP